jgi:hypothetical protein
VERGGGEEDFGVLKADFGVLSVWGGTIFITLYRISLFLLQKKLK